MIPNNLLHLTATGRDEILSAVTKAIRQNRNWNLEVSSPVIFRTREGPLRRGILISLDDLEAQIYLTDGTFVLANAEEVFPDSGGESKIIFWADPIFNLYGSKLGPNLRAYLNGGLEIISRPEFRKLSSGEKVQVLKQYHERVFHTEPEGTHAERVVGEDLEKILAVGAGVCRHNAHLLALLLNEAGFKARVIVWRKDLIVTYGILGEEVPEDVGHAWLEVEIDHDGRTLPWLLDLHLVLQDGEGVQQDGVLAELHSFIEDLRGSPTKTTPHYRYYILKEGLRSTLRMEPH